jgi:hypothetical protein
MITKHSNILQIQYQLYSAFLIVMTKLFESVSYTRVTSKSNSYVYEDICVRLIISGTVFYYYSAFNVLYILLF